MNRLERVLGSWVLFALALLVAARLRLLHVITLRRTPFFSTLIGDADLYDRWAQRLASGDGGTQPFFVDPLYPHFLSVLYRLFGHDLFVVRLAQVGLAIVTCALVGLLARQLGGPVAGNLAAWAWAHFRPDLFNTAEVDKTTLGLVLVAAALLLALRPSLAARAAAGLLLGLATLTRGNLLLAALTPAVFYALEERPLRLQSHAVRSAAIFLGALVLALAPVTLRNRAVSGQWVLTTTGAGANFYLGNNAQSGSGGYDAVPFVRPEARYEEADFHAEAERREGRELTASEASVFWLAEGLHFVAEHPVITARRLLFKLWLLTNDFEMGDMLDPEALSRFAPVLALPLPGVGWFFPLGVLGAAVTFRRKETRMLVAFTATLAVSIAAFFVLARIRVFLMPAVVALAAPGLAWLVKTGAERRWRQLGWAALLVAVLSLSSLWPPPAAKLVRAIGPLNVARVLSSRGLFVEAEQLLLEARAAAPAEPGPSCALGELALTQHRVAEARAHAERCLEAGGSRGAWLLMGKIEEADHHPDRAAIAYRRQLKLVPTEEQATRLLEALDGGAPP